MKKRVTEDEQINKPTLADKDIVLFIVLSIIVFALNSFLLNRFTIGSKHISVLTTCMILAVCFWGFILSKKIKTDCLKIFLKGIAFAALIAFGIETFFFNAKSFAVENEEIQLENLADIEFNYPENVVIDGDSITVNGDVEMTVIPHAYDINALMLEFDGSDLSSFQCCLSIKDDNFSREFIKVGEKLTSADYGKCEFSFKPYGELQAVLIGFSSVSDPLVINSIKFSKALPFYFSEFRFYILFLFLVLIIAVRSFELYKVVYDRKNIKHRAVIAGIGLLYVLSMLCFSDPTASDVEYTKGMDVSKQNPYVQMFDAFCNGRTYIAIEPSESLLESDNPYDASLRVADGVEFAWDRAFYDGKYYSYYGIAPVLTYYYPYYFIKHRLPSMNKACIFFGMMSVIFMFGVILVFVKRFIKRPNFLALIMCMLASVFASGIYFNVDFSDMYALPGITGTCYLMLCLWCGLEASMRLGGKKQTLLFALCGIAFVLCLASKPTRALSCLVLAPAFLEVLFNKKISLKNKCISVTAFIVPVIIGTGAIMLYNYARFDSPFEFGAIYQLTVSDVGAGRLRLSLFPDAILHYFIQPVQMTGMFPFVKIDGVWLANSQVYIYSDFAIGALSVLLIAVGILFLPFLLRCQKEKGKQGFNNLTVKNVTYIMIFVMALFIAWFNYCVAGIILSYVCDILPLLTLLSIFVLLDVQIQMVDYRVISEKMVSLISLISIITIFLTFLEIISFQNIALNHCFPNLIFELEDLFCFWN